jgi:hypothetical protein
VRRVSRNSMLISIKQTKEAVRMRHAGSSANAGNMSSASAAFKQKASAFSGVQ